MTDDAMVIMLFVGFFGILPLVVLITVICWVLYVRKQRKEVSPKEEEKIDEEIIKPEAVFDEVRVLSKRIWLNYVGYVRALRSVYTYFVTFEKEDGTKVEMSVSQDYFEMIEEGQTGTLVTLNGRFIDFGDGEELEENDAKEETVRVDDA